MTARDISDFVGQLKVTADKTLNRNKEKRVMTKEQEFTELERIIEDLSDNTEFFKSNGMTPEKATKVIKKFESKAKELLESGISLEEAATEFEYRGSLFVILKERMRKTKNFKERDKLRDLHEQDIVGAIQLEKLLVSSG